jgi:hypothetical protein
MPFQIPRGSEAAKVKALSGTPVPAIGTYRLFSKPKNLLYVLCWLPNRSQESGSASPHDLGNPRSIPVTRVEGYQNMFEKQTPKIDAVCILLLALFLVGLAMYSVIIHIRK